MGFTGRGTSPINTIVKIDLPLKTNQLSSFQLPRIINILIHLKISTRGNVFCQPFIPSSLLFTHSIPKANINGHSDCKIDLPFLQNGHRGLPHTTTMVTRCRLNRYHEKCIHISMLPWLLGNQLCEHMCTRPQSVCPGYK